jgi:phosphoribosylformylglycinamidine synthase
VAIVNCLNFGNPEHPEVMWQLSQAIDGMAEACRALGVPVIGGNVSLYNESRGRDIDPTPVVGTLGLVDRLERRPPGPGLVEGSDILLIGAGAGRAAPNAPSTTTGAPGTPGATGAPLTPRASQASPGPPTSLAGSRWAADLHGHRGGRLPALDLDLHARLLELVRDLIDNELVDGVHDISDGGLGVALAEMAVGSQVGFQVEGIADHRELFAEGPSRVLVSVAPPAFDQVRTWLASARVGWARLGVAGGDRLIIAGLVDLPLAQARTAWQAALPAALGTLPAVAEGAGPA